MAAGQGFKTFTTGEVLTAGDVNGYLMQGINVFTNATARDAAITAPAEGQFAFTKDNNSLWYYDGAAWVASGATGDIEGVTAGVGISGGGTSGTVTITNSMATAITTAGDLIKGTGSGTFDRLGIGSTGQVLTVAAGAPTWATPATPSSGLTKLVATTFSGVSSYSAPNNTFSATYNAYRIMIELTSVSTNGNFSLRARAGGTDYSSGGYLVQRVTGITSSASADSSAATYWALLSNNTNTRYLITFDWYKPYGTGQHLAVGQIFNNNSSGNFMYNGFGARIDTADPYDAFTVYPDSGTITGSVAVYGYSL